MKISLLLAVLLFGVGACGSSPRGPFLMIGAGLAPPNDATIRAAQATMALEALPAATLVKFESLLTRARDEARAMANPLHVDIEPSELRDELESLIKAVLPSLTAAQAIAAMHYELADGLSAALVDHCGSEGRESCFPVWNAPDATATQRRARFAAWPLSFAILLRTDQPAVRVAAALRPPSGHGRSSVALVITRHPEAVDHQLRERVRSRARELLHYLEATDVGERVWVRAIATARPAPRPYLGSDEVLIVPRLGALAHLDRFQREVEAQLRRLGLSSQVHWLQRPA